MMRHLIETYANYNIQYPQTMGQYCLPNQPVHQYEIIFGFFVFALFFFLLCYCHKASTRLKNIQRQSKLFKSKILPKSKSKYCFNEYEHSDQKSISEEQENPTQKQISKVKQAPKAYSNLRTNQQTLKKLSRYAYQYHQNEHEMTKIYRSAKQIIQERQLYLNRTTTKSIPTKNQTVPEKQKQKQKQKQKTNINGTIKKTESVENLSQLFKKQEQKLKQKQVKPEQKQPDIPKSNIFNQINLFGEKKDKPEPKISDQTANKNVMINTEKQKGKQIQKSKQKDLAPNANLFFPLNTNQKKAQNQMRPTQNKLNIINKPPSQNKQQNLLKPVTIQPKLPIPPIKPDQGAPKLSQIGVKVVPKGGDAKISSSVQYLDAIIKYASTFTQKKQISTLFNNLSGAKSDPVQLWLFSTDFIKTLNTNDIDQVKTFAYKIFESVVHKFIKFTNIKEGFQKIPPKEKSKQIQKNSINTYVLMINIFRYLGHQGIWLAVFGHTLKLVDFIYKRKQPIKVWTKLDLITLKYIIFQGDISSKYHSRIDFLFYFLLGLTTFDPILAFQEVAQKTGQSYQFLAQLRKSKHKWSYREFWCLIDVVKRNPLVSYFKIPFWGNVLPTIYLQMFQNYKNPERMKEFMSLSKWIFKQIKLQTSLLGESEQSSALEQQFAQNRQKKYDFDGQQFVNGIKSFGKSFQTKQRQMRISRWEQFRQKCSIFYYFWRLDL